MTKARPRRSARSKARALVPNPFDSIGIADQLSDQILFAQGIKLAVWGEAHITGSDTSPISELIDIHINQLQAISDQVHPPLSEVAMKAIRDKADRRSALRRMSR